MRHGHSDWEKGESDDIQALDYISSWAPMRQPLAEMSSVTIGMPYKQIAVSLSSASHSTGLKNYTTGHNANTWTKTNVMQSTTLQP